MNKTDFKTSNYFPGYVYYSGFVFVALGLTALNINSIVSVILIFAGLIFITTHYRLTVDLNNKAYHDYVWFLGFRSGEKGKFSMIEYLFITKSNVSQTMQLRGAPSTIHKEVYDGFLKFSEHEKLHLVTLDNKESLIKKLKSISAQLKTNIVDYSNGQPVKI